MVMSDVYDRFPGLEDILSRGSVHTVRITEHGESEKKLALLAEHRQFFSRHKFSENDLEAIAHGTDWEGKIHWIVENYENVLRPMQFNGSHVAQIVVGAGWQEKLDWIVENYKKVLQPMKFNGYHVAQIVVGAGWQEKLDWMTHNYKSVLQSLGITQSTAAKIVKGAEWQEKLNWAANYFATSGLKQSALCSRMNKKNWREALEYAA